MSSLTSPASPALLVIEPTRGWRALRLAELWEYRELLYFLVWRDIKVRYKQTALGVLWAVLQPLTTMIIFTIFFGRLAGISSEGLPYPLFSYAALLPWSFFAFGLSYGSNSLVGAAHLITKVYFPRLVVPVAAVLSGLVDFLLALALVIPMLLYYGQTLHARALLIPVFFLMAFILALGVSLWLSALNVEYRDIRHVIPFVAQIWLFMTPVIYPASAVVPRLEALGLPGWLLGLNPMAGVVEGFRWALLSSFAPSAGVIAASALLGIAILISGAFYFRRMERSFADVV